MLRPVRKITGGYRPPTVQKPPDLFTVSREMASEPPGGQYQGPTSGDQPGGQPPSPPPPPPPGGQQTYTPPPGGGYQQGPGGGGFQPSAPGGGYPVGYGGGGGGGQYSGFGLRVAAFIIDLVILFIVNSIISVIFAGGVGRFAPVATLIELVIEFLYFGILWSQSSPLGAGQTIGNRLLGIRVAREDGSPLSIGAGLGRSALLLVTGIICAIGWIVSFITSLTTQRHQALHDMPLNTTTLRA